MIEPIDNLIYESMKSGNKTELNAYKNIKTDPKSNKYGICCGYCLLVNVGKN